MSKHGRDIELLRQNDNDLMVQYEELLCLQAELARLLFPLKISPPRKYRIKRKNWSAARPVNPHERQASCDLRGHAGVDIFVQKATGGVTTRKQIPFPKKHLPPHRVCFMANPMSTSPDTFEPLFVVGNWLDACRRGELDALLNFYDERATLECDCEHVSLTGTKWIAAHWAPKLDSNAILAFSLNEMTLTADGVRLDYQSYEGKPVRIDFRFSPSGKILQTSCGPLGHCTA